jgi:3-oxoadipate enol-lactonase
MNLSFTGHHLDAKRDSLVVLLHAFPLSAAMWQSQLDALKHAGYPAVAPHVFGVGDSPKKQNWSMDDYADALRELISSLSFKHATLVGVSMGGYQAFAFYRKFPDMVRSLVLSDTRADSDTDAARQSRKEFIAALEKNGIDEAVSRMASKLLGETTKQTEPQLTVFITDLIRQNSSSAVIEQLKALAGRADSGDLLANISVPTLVVVGEEDVLTPPDLARTIHAGVKNSMLKIIPKAGHLPNLESPNVFNEHLLAHLETLSPANA